MPRKSYQQKALAKARQKLYPNIAVESGSDDDLDSPSDVDSIHNVSKSDSSDDIEFMSSGDSEYGADLLEVKGNCYDLLKLYLVIDNIRYFQERGVFDKSKEFVRQYFFELSPILFRQMTHMDKRAFFHLVELIDTHRVFYSNSPDEQAPVEWQLAVTLNHLGHNGNGSCLNCIIPTWGGSIGSLCNYSKRCFEALEVALKTYLRWHNMMTRRQIADKFALKGFPGCVGLIDGTGIPLSQRPKESRECYYNRKSRFSINSQVVCDHN